ncbi:MAG TPA: FAD-dependent monooxygenase [Steroidobacteraceae bacterium]|nr:FAD-dependent monooxygenase [Steroidobacteraceae bacterium]
MTSRVDVAVLGAGPAGAAVARRLAAAGVAVAVVTGPAPAPAREGYSRRTVERLRAEGLDEVLATLAGPVARDGRWGERRVDGLEWLADRAEVATALARALARAGVRCVAGPATRVARSATGFAVESGAGRVEAPLVVDARGRRGPQSRGPLLLALGRRHALATGRPGTRIAPWSRGWCWLADDGEQVFVQLVGAARGAERPPGWFAAAAAEVDGLAAILAAPPAGALIARPAHARLGRASPDPGLWRVGDAALALDPLSGQGAYEALRGATAVAAALATVLEGGDAALAARFVADRYRDAWSRAVATAAGFYDELAGRGPFWADTAAAYRALAAPIAAGPPRVERRPVLEQGRIRERAVLVTASAPRGAWQVAGVPLVALLELARDAAPAAPAVLDAARRLDRPPPAIEQALGWLRASGALAAPRGASLSSGV